MMQILGKRLLIVLLLAEQGPSLAEVYRWVDEKGQVHFGDQAKDASTHSLKPHSGQPTANTGQQRMEKTRKLLNAYRIERQQMREQQAQQKKQAEERKRNCMRARDDLRRYTDYGSIYALGEDGRRRYLSEQERTVLLQRSRDAVIRLCGRS